MRFLIVVLLALLAWIGSPGSSRAAEPSRVRLFCLSVRVEPGEANLFGLKYTLVFTSARFATPNAELFPIFEDDLTHASLFRMEAPDLPEPLGGDIGFNVPESIDANTNGIPDFYEVSMEIPTSVTQGLWANDDTGGTVKATWQRAAGQIRGSVKIQLTSDEFGVLPEFSHAFEILEYDGSMTYSGTGETRTGTMSVQRIGAAGSTLMGPLVMTRVPTNRLHQFTIGESRLTNDLGQVVPVSLGELESDPDYTMDYFGAMSLLNGDPSTPEVDYELFFIGIDDPNDADADGIPDLTDDTRPPPPPPGLGVRRTADAAELVVTGEPGVTYALERASELDPELWQVDRMITVEVSPVVISIPAGPAPSRFYRLRWP